MALLLFVRFTPIKSVLFLIFLVMSHGWYATYRMQVVACGAAGDEELPDVNETDPWTLVTSLMQWLGSWVVALIPVYVYFTCLALTGQLQMGAFDLISALNSPRDSFTDPGFVIALGLSLYLWPMVVLCVSLGGIETLMRPDLLLVTMFRSLGGYSITAVLVACTFIADFAFAAFFTRHVIGKLLANQAATGTPPTMVSLIEGLLFARVVICAVGGAVTVYLDIVAMQVIGLYYRHFKERFAWDWG